ncbi:hypothetical protein BP6252_02717 [Coleophoma cylindrospora]|uniref:Uncharacterized protein n=1 Tax=Coleophoma cylindrospora TaxID=1849047 RepID=A0A3D8SFK9_9HELO|nr:hypothetical protein BP6252_02717 [Coleophoma cylindrospora]
MAYNPFTGPTPEEVRDYYRKMAEGQAAQRNIEAKNVAAEDFFRMMNIRDPAHRVLARAAFEDEPAPGGDEAGYTQGIPRWEINDKNEEIQAQNSRLVLDGSTRAMARLIYPLYTSDGVFPQDFQQPMTVPELKNLPTKAFIHSRSGGFSGAKLTAILNAYQINEGLPTTAAPAHASFRSSTSPAFPNPLNLPQRRLPATIPNRAGLVPLFPQGCNDELAQSRSGNWDADLSVAAVRRAKFNALLGFLGVGVEENDW